MDVWIRSQDKTVLRLCCNIDIYEVDNNRYVIEGDGTDLGTYKSKERALEILDNISKALAARYMLKTNSLVKKETLENAKRYYESLNDIRIVATDTLFNIEPTCGNCYFEMPEE